MAVIQQNKPLYDPHLHLFYLGEGDYSWLKKGLPSWPRIAKIQRSFTEQDLLLCSPFSLVGYNHVEAGFDNLHPENEVAHLEQVNGQNHSAIAYLPLDCPSSEFSERLSLLTQFSTFRGVRDITEGSDANKLLDETVHNNIKLLANNHLILEVQFELSQLLITEELVKLALANPSLSIVINHAGLVTSDCFDNWYVAILKLKDCHNIFIKYSGFEMQERTLDDAFRVKVFNSLITEWDENRMMFASNFPVCLMTSSYQELWQHYRILCPNDTLWQKLSVTNSQRLYCGQ